MPQKPITNSVENIYRLKRIGYANFFGPLKMSVELQIRNRNPLQGNNKEAMREIFIKQIIINSGYQRGANGNLQGRWNCIKHDMKLKTFMGISGASSPQISHEFFSFPGESAPTSRHYNCRRFNSFSNIIRGAIRQTTP